jgi:hypothetical protein
VRRADNLTTFMCRLSKTLGASTSWSPKGLPRPVWDCFTFTHILNQQHFDDCLIAVRVAVVNQRPHTILFFGSSPVVSTDVMICPSSTTYFLCVCARSYKAKNIFQFCLPLCRKHCIISLYSNIKLTRTVYTFNISLFRYTLQGGNTLLSV